MSAAKRGSIAMVLVAALFAGGCSPGMAFRENRSLTITSPPYRGKVEVPVTVTWSLKPDLERAIRSPNDRIAGFLVLVDREPQPPGVDLAWFARDDEACVSARGCPDVAYLAERRIFTTRGTSITIRQLSPREGVARHRANTHDVTLVLVDETGRRIGESVWTTTFVVRSRED